jgi:hypothetical protein
MDGKAFRPMAAPQHRGSRRRSVSGVNLATYRLGNRNHWNAFVANLECTVGTPSTRDRMTPPVPGRRQGGSATSTTTLTSSRRSSRHCTPSPGGAAAAQQGASTSPQRARAKDLDGRRRCASRHVPPFYTGPGYNLHQPPRRAPTLPANRPPTGMYRTTTLKGMFAKSKRGFGAASPPDPARRRRSLQQLLQARTSAAEKNDPVQFLLKSR